MANPLLRLLQLPVSPSSNPALLAFGTLLRESAPPASRRRSSEKYREHRHCWCRCARRSDDTSDDTDAFSNSAKLVGVTFDWDHAIFGNPMLYNTDRFQKSNDLYWLQLQVYF
jgi:hypothetical protein